MPFYLGCAVWSYKGWVGEFFPPKTPASDYLRCYSDRLTAVEGNTTFYAVPDAATIARWVEQTPSSFKFCLKFPKSITHQGLLSANIPQALDFIDKVKGLGDRLGPIFAQLPPTYSPQLLDDLSQFLQALSEKKVKLAVEIRHIDWFEPIFEQQLNQCLQQLHVGRVLLDTRPIYNAPAADQPPQFRRKPQLPLHPYLTADFTLIRFISHPQAQYNERYLQEWLNQIDAWLRTGKEIYFFVHCPIEERSPFTARDFQQQLEQSGIGVPLLPWNQITAIPQQLNLFD